MTRIIGADLCQKSQPSGFDGKVILGQEEWKIKWTEQCSFVVVIIYTGSYAYLYAYHHADDPTYELTNIRTILCSIIDANLCSNIGDSLRSIIGAYLYAYRHADDPTYKLTNIRTILWFNIGANLRSIIGAYLTPYRGHCLRRSLVYVQLLVRR